MTGLFFLPLLTRWTGQKQLLISGRGLSGGLLGESGCQNVPNIHRVTPLFDWSLVHVGVGPTTNKTFQSGQAKPTPLMHAP